MAGVEDINQWAVVQAARRVTHLWNLLQSARLAYDCFPDDPDLPQTICDLELDLGLALEALSRFFGDEDGEVASRNLGVLD